MAKMFIISFLMAGPESEPHSCEENSRQVDQNISYEEINTVLHWLGEGSKTSFVDIKREKTFVATISDKVRGSSLDGEKITDDEISLIGLKLIQEVTDSAQNTNPLHEASLAAINGIPTEADEKLKGIRLDEALPDAIKGISKLVYAIRLNAYNSDGLIGMGSQGTEATSSSTITAGELVYAFGYFDRGVDQLSIAIAKRKSTLDNQAA